MSLNGEGLLRGDEPTFPGLGGEDKVVRSSDEAGVDVVERMRVLVEKKKVPAALAVIVALLEDCGAGGRRQQV